MKEIIIGSLLSALILVLAQQYYDYRMENIEKDYSEKVLTTEKKVMVLEGDMEKVKGRQQWQDAMTMKQMQAWETVYQNMDKVTTRLKHLEEEQAKITKQIGMPQK